jgi:hypothetical protein
MEDIAESEDTAHTEPSITLPTILRPEPAPNVDIRLQAGSSSVLVPYC